MTHRLIPLGAQRKRAKEPETDFVRVTDPESVRAQTFRQLFGGDPPGPLAPIESRTPQRTSLPGPQIVPCYFVDFQRITEAQMTAITAYIVGQIPDAFRIADLPIAGDIIRPPLRLRPCPGGAQRRGMPLPIAGLTLVPGGEPTP